MGTRMQQLSGLRYLQCTMSSSPVPSPAQTHPRQIAALGNISFISFIGQYFSILHLQVWHAASAAGAATGAGGRAQGPRGA